MNIHPITTPASPSLASPLFDASFDSIESLTTSFAAFAVPTLETTTVTEVALGYHRNQQYSITAMTTSSGAVAERYAYTAYGQPTILNANGSVLTSSAVGNRYTYTGREWDETLGIHHFRARWMSPLAGRFLGRDPIGYEGSEWGLYEYVNSQPMVGLDPTGLEGWGGIWTAEELLKEAEKRRGNGPWKDSAQHCWAVCRAQRLAIFAQGLGDILELLSPSNDWLRDLLAHRAGTLCGSASSCIPYFLASRYCDNCCLTYPS